MTNIITVLLKHFPFKIAQIIERYANDKPCDIWTARYLDDLLPSHPSIVWSDHVELLDCDGSCLKQLRWNESKIAQEARSKVLNETFHQFCVRSTPAIVRSAVQNSLCLKDATDEEISEWRMTVTPPKPISFTSSSDPPPCSPLVRTRSIASQQT